MKDLTPSFNIVMLGSSGAGKTLYLASLHHALSLLNPDLGFYIETDSQKTLILNRYAAMLANPNVEWPAGTRSLQQWEFTCYVNNLTDRVKAFDFKYIDYAGGTLIDILENDTHSAQQQELFQSIENANVLLGLLDGEKIIDFMEDNNSEKLHHFKSIDLPNMILQIKRCKPTIPVHFVISKWDMVTSLGGYRVAEIRDKLMTNAVFRNFLNNREHINRSIVRLIPVSSIGLNKASYKRDIEAGQISTIRESHEIDPYNVTVPLSYVLGDSIRSSIQVLEARKQSMNSLQRLLFSFRSIFKHPLIDLLPPGLDWIVKASAFTAGMLEQQNSQAFIRFFTGEIGNINKQQDALKYMMDICAKTALKFEDGHPGTILTVSKTM
jgi:hypothetical protein